MIIRFCGFLRCINIVWGAFYMEHAKVGVQSMGGGSIRQVGPTVDISSGEGCSFIVLHTKGQDLLLTCHDSSQVL